MAATIPAALAADRYRVEVLVLQHLNSTQEASELNVIRDYSAALDFLTPIPDGEEPALDGCAPTPGEALSVMRHSCAHIMARAAQERG